LVFLRCPMLTLATSTSALIDLTRPLTFLLVTALAPALFLVIDLATRELGEKATAVDRIETIVAAVNFIVADI